MAKELGIKRCWFHNGRYPHYDIPKRRIEEILAREDVTVVDGHDVLRICKGASEGKG
jgi:hypothetical protein